jgi:KDO2-lipid IV(A) lauroyltransferase
MPLIRSLLMGFLSLVCFVIAYLPRRIQLLLGWCLGILWFDFFRIRRKVAIENLGIAFPDWTMAKKTKVARASLVNMGHTIIEFAIMVHFKPTWVGEYFEFEGLEYYDKAISEGKGCLGLSMHVGNGDFACMGLGIRGRPLTVISKQFKSEWLNEAWFNTRKKYGTRFIREEKSSYDILKALKKNQHVVFVLDQFMGPPAGIETTFFGKKTGTAAGLALFQLRSKLSVLPTYNFRRGGKVVAKLEKPLEVPITGDRSVDIPILTQKYNDKIEEIVRQYPEQWMWIHRRWKEYKWRR